MSKSVHFYFRNRKEKQERFLWYITLEERLSANYMPVTTMQDFSCVLYVQWKKRV